MLASIYMNAEVVGTYHNSYFKTDLTIEATLNDNDTFSYAWISVISDKNDASIVVEHKDLENFISSLTLARDKFTEWKHIAKTNKVTKMYKEMNIDFPDVTLAWKGVKMWFSFDNPLKMRFMILSSGEMVASWSPEAIASENQYIKNTIYFVFSNVDDFNSLISQLNPQQILRKLSSTKQTENLFQ